MAAAEDSTFDVDAYASRYNGVGKVRRLAYLADRAATPSVRMKALDRALDAVISDSLDARAYRSLSVRTGRPDDGKLDELARAGEEKIAAVTKALEIAKARSLKDEIVKNMAELAAAHRDVGDLQQALMVLQTSREYAPSAKHVADINLQMLELALLIGSYATVTTLIMKLQTAATNAGDGGMCVFGLFPSVCWPLPITTPTPPLTHLCIAALLVLHHETRFVLPLIISVCAAFDAPLPHCSLAAKLRASQGLVALAEGHFEGAARELLALPQRLGGTFSAVAHIEELALVGGLCALATYSRDELRSRLLGEPGPRALLEMVPQLRDAVQAFVSSRYAACLEGLGRLATDALRGDLFLGPHADRLLSAVRRRALTQYLTPYTAVDLTVMAAAFRVPVPVLEAEIAELIVGEGLKARLDSERKLLLQHTTDTRADALAAATAAARAFGAEARMLLLRASMEMEGLFVGSSAGGDGGRSGGGSAAVAAVLEGEGDESAALSSKGDRERLADADVLAAHAREGKTL